MTATTQQRFTLAEKRRSCRFLEQGDKVESVWSKGLRGVVLGAYDQFVWVLWENAAEKTGGVWLPETVGINDIRFAGLPTPKGNMFAD